MVCMGNICRSPMAEGITKHVFEKKGIQAEIDSAGTIGFHAGEAPDHRAQLEMQKVGIDISNQKSRKVTMDDFSYFDKIFAMDQSNFSNLLELCPKEHQHKIDMIMNLVEEGKNRNVPDPYYGGDQGFKLVRNMLDRAANALADKIINQTKI